MLSSLCAAGLWGATDACAGLSARRSTPILAAVWLHLASLVVLGPMLLAGIGVSSLSPSDVYFGVGAGILAAVGDVFFGIAVRNSTMSVGIPLANVIAAAIPASIVALQGDHFGGLVAVGVLGAVIASGLAVAPSNGTMAWRGAGYAMLAGVCFGGMFGLLTQVAAASSLLVVFVMRVAGTVALVPAAWRESGAWRREHFNNGLWIGVLSGVASVAANELYVAGMTIGERVTHAALAVGLAAPAGMIIANLIQRECLSRMQAASAFVAVVSIGALSVAQY